jgi:glycine dehydrogenase
MLSIRKEVDEIVGGKQPKDSNVIKNAPHPISLLSVPDSEWKK